MSNKLFVGNLSFQTTEFNLEDEFAKHGTVVEARLMMDPTTSRSRGFAFVTMQSDEEAQNAISSLNGKEWNGREIEVSVARPRAERPAGNFGGSGGGRRRNSY